MGTGPSLGEPHHKQLNMLNTTLINSINIQSLGTPWVLPPSYKLLCLKLKKIGENKFLLAVNEYTQFYNPFQIKLIETLKCFLPGKKCSELLHLLISWQGETFLDSITQPLTSKKVRKNSSLLLKTQKERW